MKNISKDEFKQAIKRLINGEITKVKLAKELETDPRTLDNRIQELSATDPELYYEYVDVLPYKQKGIDHIDFEALVIYMLKNGCTADETAQKFEVSRRTINRRINDLENKELREMYREVADNRKHGRNNGVELDRKISELEPREVIKGGVNDRRKRELLAIESRFNKLCETMDKTQAAKTMGYGDRDRLYKLMYELYKLEIEEEHKKVNKEQPKEEDKEKNKKAKRPELEDEGRKKIWQNFHR